MTRMTSTATGEPTVLESAQGAFPLCDSRVFNAAVLQRIEAVFRAAQQEPAFDDT
jgi:hypothetical protein